MRTGFTAQLQDTTLLFFFFGLEGSNSLLTLGGRTR